MRSEAEEEKEETKRRLKGERGVLLSGVLLSGVLLSGLLFFFFCFSSFSAENLVENFFDEKALAVT